MITSQLILISVANSNVSAFEKGKSLAIMGVVLFVFLSLFVIFPRNSEMPTEPGLARSILRVAVWGRWFFLVVGMIGVVMMIAA